MRDFDQEAKKEGPQGHAPQKAKAPVEDEHTHAHSKAAEPLPQGALHAEILRDGRIAHPANAEPLAELLSQLQHSHGNAYVQQVVSEAGEAKPPETAPAAETQAPSVVQGLDSALRSEMESAFGESFGDVRVHTGGEAERMNEELGARAVTRGRDVYFDRGEYEPHTTKGKELLAHELAHVVQQGGAAGRQASSADNPGDKHEQEADRAAREVLSGGHATVLQSTSAPSYQRQAREGGQKQAAGGINLDREPNGSLGGGISYSYDAASHRLTLTGPPGMSVSPSVRGGHIVLDSARATMAPQRHRTVTIGVSGIPLIVTINGTPYTFIRYQGAA